MSRVPKRQIFLQRANYRQRRVRDAAKLLPFAGLMLWLLPLGWSMMRDDNDPIGSGGLIYIFAVWVILIVLAAVFSNMIRADEQNQSDAVDDDGR